MSKENLGSLATVDIWYYLSIHTANIPKFQMRGSKNVHGEILGPHPKLKPL